MVLWTYIGPLKMCESVDMEYDVGKVLGAQLSSEGLVKVKSCVGCLLSEQ